MTKLLLRIPFLLIGWLLFSCNSPKAEPSFYYWRTAYQLSVKEANTLKDLDVKTLYIRFFDVDLSKDTKQPQPYGVIDSLNGLHGISVIPVVYITNRTFIELTDTAVLALAKHVVHKINGISTHYNELQFDCDWSGKTKDNYFLFLSTVRSLIEKKIKLTATIRLHQVKYPVKTGVPPVDGGMIMFYNMGDLTNTESSNSIFDKKIAEKYTAYINDYALHLDAALPIFRWYVHYRNKKIIGLITKKQLPNVNDTSNFIITSANRYTVKQENLVNGVYYRKGDVLNYEALNDEELMQAAELLHKHLNEEDRRIVFYDLDELNINYYESNTLKKVLAVFN